MGELDLIRWIRGRIGKRAGRIVVEREKKPFASVEDLRRVSGIGAKTLEKLRPFLSFP